MTQLKINHTLLALCCFLILLGCGGNKNEAQNNKKAMVDKSASEKTEREETKDPEDSNSEEAAETMTAEQLEKAKDIIAEADKSAVKGVNADKVFKMHCASCHGFKGNMMVNGAKDLSKSKIDLVNSVAQVYHGKGLMTPYKGILKSEEIVAVCQYIETLRK